MIINVIIIIMTVICSFIFLFIVNNITIHDGVNPAQVLFTYRVVPHMHVVFRGVVCNSWVARSAQCAHTD